MELPAGRQSVAQGRTSGRSSGLLPPLVPPWVSVPTICPLSLNTFLVLGERVRVRGKTWLIHENHASRRVMFREQRNETRHSVTDGQWLQ